MIVQFINLSGVYVYATEIKPPNLGHDNSGDMPEIIQRGLTLYVMRGLRWNDHADRYELVYQQTRGVLSL